ncbi:MAG: ribosome maturation factor RimP [Christensenellaceae bacterium]
MQTKSAEEIRSAIEGIASSMNVEIVDVEIKTKGALAVTVFIETEDGVDLDTCAAFHSAIDLPLDELDPTFGVPYTLNVSSPGLDRPFKSARDFERNIGERVEIRLYAPYQGKKFLVGVLADFTEHTVTIDGDKGTITLERNKIAKINKEIVFED